MHFHVELTYLRLVKLDISGNRISVLPNEIRKMKGLVDFRLSDNPLTSPPASVSIRKRFISSFPLKKERQRERDRENPIFSLTSYALSSDWRILITRTRYYFICRLCCFHHSQTFYILRSWFFRFGHFIQDFICEFPNQYPEIIR